MYLQTVRHTSQALLADKPNRVLTITLYALGRTVKYQRRTGGAGTMGRFGGGWEIKFGIQSGSLKELLTMRSLIVDLFVCSFRFGVQNEARRTTERQARERDAVKVVPLHIEDAVKVNLKRTQDFVNAVQRDMQKRPTAVAAEDDLPY